MKKKILILCNDFPPLISVGGERPYSWFRYFQKYGFDTVVIAKEVNGVAINTELEKVNYVQSNKNISTWMFDKLGENKFVYIRKVFTLFYSIFQFFAPVGVHWLLYKKADELLKREKFDAILVTGEPFILFRYASKLSKKHSVKWFADYRDDWIENHTRTLDKSFLNKLLLSFESNFEKKFLNTAAGFTSVSKNLVDQIQNRIGLTNNAIVENGVDIENFKNCKNPFLENTFNIVYTGRLYDLNYLEDFKIGLDNFLTNNSNSVLIKIYFIGIEKHLNQATNIVYELKSKWGGNIEILTSMSPKNVANYQLNANLLLNFIAGDPSIGLVGAKSYVYAATKKPILTIPAIKTKQTSFLPNKNIQFLALDEFEINDFMQSTLDNWLIKIPFISDLTDDEIFEISREFNSKKMLDFIKS